MAKDVILLDYYANVTGRDIVFGKTGQPDASSITTDPRNHIMQIWDIVRNELGYDADWYKSGGGFTVPANGYALDYLDGTYGGKIQSGYVPEHNKLYSILILDRLSNILQSDSGKNVIWLLYIYNHSRLNRLPMIPGRLEKLLPLNSNSFKFVRFPISFGILINSFALIYNLVSSFNTLRPTGIDPLNS